MKLPEKKRIGRSNGMLMKTDRGQTCSTSPDKIWFDANNAAEMRRPEMSTIQWRFVRVAAGTAKFFHLVLEDEIEKNLNYLFMQKHSH